MLESIVLSSSETDDIFTRFLGELRSSGTRGNQAADRIIEMGATIARGKKLLTHEVKELGKDMSCALPELTDPQLIEARNQIQLTLITHSHTHSWLP